MEPGRPTSSLLASKRRTRKSTRYIDACNCVYIQMFVWGYKTSCHGTSLIRNLAVDAFLDMDVMFSALYSEWIFRNRDASLLVLHFYFHDCGGSWKGLVVIGHNVLRFFLTIRFSKRAVSGTVSPEIWASYRSLGVQNMIRLIDCRCFQIFLRVWPNSTIFEVFLSKEVKIERKLSCGRPLERFIASALHTCNEPPKHQQNLWDALQCHTHM